MDLTEAQISGIKNLQMIYVFSTDSIFNNESNKYVGAKVVYDKNKTFALDYTDQHFQKFIKKILERYHKEKSQRKIILLGELTRKLVNDSSFAVLDKEKKEGIQDNGLPSYNTTSSQIKKYESFLKDTMKTILLVYKNYEVLDVTDIVGFNNRYIVKYNIGSVEKELPIIINIIDSNKIEFRLSRIDGLKAIIGGTINSDGGKVNVSWKSNDEELEGTMTYDSLESNIEKKVTSDGVNIIYDDNKDTILEEDISLIKFYFELCDMKIPSHILKINDNSFLLSDETFLNSDENEILYTNIGAQINISEDEVTLKYRLKNCFSKYNNQINTVLDSEKEEITLRKIEIENKKFLLMERKISSSDYKDTFSHEIIEVEKDINMREPFETINRFKSDEELQTLEQAKQFVKKRKGVK